MVFSGIIEEVGTVVSLTKQPDVALWDGSVGEGWVLVVAARAALAGAYLGASIAVNGTCLTVTAFDEGSFTVGLAPETCVCRQGGERVGRMASAAAEFERGAASS
jgi:riboflavin synthase